MSKLRWAKQGTGSIDGSVRYQVTTKDHDLWMAEYSGSLERWTVSFATASGMSGALSCDVRSRAERGCREAIRIMAGRRS